MQMSTTHTFFISTNIIRYKEYLANTSSSLLIGYSGPNHRHAHRSSILMVITLSARVYRKCILLRIPHSGDSVDVLISRDIQMADCWERSFRLKQNIDFILS